MYNYYEVLGLKNFENDIDLINDAYQKLSELSGDQPIIEEAYITLKNKELKAAYDEQLTTFLKEISQRNKERKQKKYKQKQTNRKIKIAITSVSLAAVVAIAGHFIIKNKRTVLPNDYLVGSYVSMNNTVKSRNDKNDFVIIEFPNYEEKITKKVYKNIEKCLEEKIPFGFHIKTNAKSLKEVTAEVARFDVEVSNYKFSYPISIEFNNEESYSDDNLIKLINEFNTKLVDLDYLVEISLSSDRFDKIKDRLDSSIRVRLRTNNKNNNNEMAESLVFNDSVLGLFLGNTETDGFFNTSIYTNEKYPYYVATNNLNNHDGAKDIIGVDLGFYDGDVDFHQIKENVDFALLRICDFKEYHNDDNLKFKDVLDSKFDNNLKVCNLLNIPYGFSVYSKATSVTEARTEANLIVNYLKSKGITGADYPLFISIDSCNNKSINNMLDSRNDTVVQIANEFCKIIEEAGFTAGISMNENDRSRFDATSGGHEVLDNYKFLYTRYASDKKFTFDQNVNEYGNICDYTVTDSPDGTYAVRFTEDAEVPGMDSESSIILVKKALK